MPPGRSTGFFPPSQAPVRNCLSLTLRFDRFINEQHSPDVTTPVVKLSVGTGFSHAGNEHDFRIRGSWFPLIPRSVTVFYSIATHSGGATY